MKNIIATLLILLTSNLLLKADIGRFEIITLQYNKTTYFLKVGNRNDSISKDLNYFDYKGSCVGIVTERVLNCLSGKEKFKLYKTLEIIELKYFKDYTEDEKLYILKDEILHIPSELKDKFNLINAFIANNYGYTYSEELKSEDNEWMNSEELIKLWSFNDGDDYCRMNLYGTKNSLTPKQLDFYKNKIKNMVKSTFNPEFAYLLKVLYKSKVIMIGVCST